MPPKAGLFSLTHPESTFQKQEEFPNVLPAALTVVLIVLHVVLPKNIAFNCLEVTRNKI
jgi:hypothetical protein